MNHHDNVNAGNENRRIARAFLTMFVPGGWSENSSPVSITRDQLDEGALMEGFAKPDDSAVERVAARNKYIHHVNAGGKSPRLLTHERFKVVCENKKTGVFNILAIADAAARKLDNYPRDVQTRGERILHEVRALNSADVVVGLSPFEVARREMSTAFLEASQKALRGNATIYRDLQTSLQNANRHMITAQNYAKQIAAPIVISTDNTPPQE